MTDIEAAVLLQRSVWTPDAAEARRLRAKAHRAGAALAALAEAVALREERVADEVTVLLTDDDTRPAPEDRCVYCDGWGYFPDTDGEGLDGDLPCGHCCETGREP